MKRPNITRVYQTHKPLPSNGINLAGACSLCSHNCGLLFDVANGEIDRIAGDPDNPLTQGYSCNKAYAITHYVKHKQRVTNPLKRFDDGSYHEISWDQAIAEIGQKLRHIADHYAPRSIANMISSQGNHLGSAFAGSVLMAVNSATHFNALGQEKTQHALTDQWMFQSGPECFFYPDEANSDYLIIFGSNPAISNRGRNATELIKAIKNNPDRTLVVVDPKRSETARRADVHLPIKVGTDAYLMLAMVALIIQNQWVDTDYIHTYAKDYAEIEKRFVRLDCQQLIERCCLDFEQVKAITHAYALADRAGLMMDLGVEQSLYSTLTAYLYRLLSALTGNIGQPGGNVFLPMFAAKGFVKPDVQRALVSGIKSIPMFVPIATQSYSLLAEEILTDHPMRIRALLVDGANPVVQAANSNVVKGAFRALDLSVVVDPAFTETAAVADYVLPPPVGYEKWEYSFYPCSFPEVYAQVRKPILNAPNNTLPEAEIYYRILKASGLIPDAPRVLHSLARRINSTLGTSLYLSTLLSMATMYSKSAPGKPKNSGFVLQWLYETLGPHLEAPQLVYIWLNAQMFALTRRDDVIRQYPELIKVSRMGLGNRIYKEIMNSPHGVFVGKIDLEKHLEDHIGFKDKKIRLAPREMMMEIDRVLSTESTIDQAYPFILQGGVRSPWNANVIIRDPGWRKGKGLHHALILSPNDADKLRVTENDKVLIETATGRAQAPVKIDKYVQDGHVHLPTGFGLEYPNAETGVLSSDGVRINELTDTSDRDPFTGCPHHKYIRCKLSVVER